MDSKKLNEILIVSNLVFLILFITVSITNYRNYTRFIKSENNLADATGKMEKYKDKIDELNKKINTKDSNKTQEINLVATEFLNAYFTYDALSKYKIYDNIKPFSTEELVNKLKPIKENDLESDVNYKVSISNIKLYSKLSTDSEESILVLADESINTNTSNSTAPTLIQLDFKYVNSKWLVNNMIINRPLKNMPFLD